ncbi:hypothetical protein GOP47_0023733 [Adiantum capillus-veneris]|uniref:E3 ubiquitin-protein ligase listerin n=1 Tax=Adiantum capillus-veneris TaxID=13818 RepID=A0A9D4U489_ADICA|nr:hypothetical protein GOP47_0023733 [Adiantum capillus-veneris]
MIEKAHYLIACNVAAASLLQSSRAIAVGFGGYVGSSRVDGPDSQDNDQPWDVDGEAAIHLRRLSKKDFTTRVKALKALITFFRERPATELCQLLPNWIFEYKKLVQDENQQVRECTHNAMSAIAVSVGRGLAPHLRMLMGAWWVSQFDPVREVSAAARQSLQVAFQGPSKRLEALMFCATDVLMYIDSLLKLSPQTISEKHVPIEESTKKYELVISSALLALAAFLDVVFQSQSSNFALGVEGIEVEKENSITKKTQETKKEVEESAARLCLNHKHFREFFKSKSSQIRCASYQALRAFAQNVSSVFSVKDIDGMAGVVLGSFSEKDPACHTAMWDMVLYFSQKYPEAWNTSATSKFVLPRLWSFLRHATYGSAKESYPCVLPLLSVLPSQTMKLSIQFLKDLFTSLWDGHNVCYMALEDQILCLKTIQECFLWVINNADRFSTGNGSSSVWSTQECMMDSVLLDILWKNYTFCGFQLSLNSSTHIVGSDTSKETPEALQKKERERYSSQFIENLRKCLIDVLSILAAKNKNLAYHFWKRFPEVCYGSVILEARQSVDSISAVRIGCTDRFSEFLSLFGKLLPSDESYKHYILYQAVRPFVAKLFPIVTATEFGDAIRLLAVIVSSFGPFSFHVPEDEREAELSESEFSSVEGNSKDLNGIFSFFEENLIPWCLNPSKSCLAEKVELLLSFFEDGRFVRKWNLVLSHAIKLEDTARGPDELNSGKVNVLAVLLENFRHKFLDLDMEQSCKSQPASQWDLSGLDKAVLTVARSLSLADDSAIHLLRHVLGGFKNTVPVLVAPETVESILRVLLHRMLYILQKSEIDWASFAAAHVLLPDVDPSLTTVEDEKAISLACASARLLCQCIYSVQLVNGLEATSKVVATFFCIQWAYSSDHFSYKREQKGQFGFEGEGKESAMVVCTDTGSSDEEDESPHHRHEFLMQNRFLAKDVQNMVKNILLLLSSGFSRNLSFANRVLVQKMLIQCVRHAAFEGTTDAQTMACACGNWLSALMDDLCTNAEDAQLFLDMLLEPVDAWPFYASESARSEHGLVLVEDGLGQSYEKIRHARFAAVIGKMASRLGWEKLVVYQGSESSGGSQSRSNGKSKELEKQCRIWLLIEMLCTWRWPGGSATDSLLPFLVACLDAEETALKESIVDSVVISLFMSALSRQEVSEYNNKYWLGSIDNVEDNKDPCLRALLFLLRKICQGDKRVEYAEKFFKMLVIDQGSLEDTVVHGKSKVLPFILSILVPVLHKQQESDRQPLSNTQNLVTLKVAVCKWLDVALSVPALSSYSEFVPDLELALQVVVACFPIHSAGGSVAVMAASSANVSTEERALLLTLMQKELADIPGFVAHVAKQYASQRESSLEWKDSRELHEEILAKLVASSIVYCWKLFTNQDWALVTHHMGKWLEAALFEAESFTQLVIESRQVEKKPKYSLTIPDKIGTEIQRISSQRGDLSWTAVVIFSLLQALESSNFTGSSTSLKHLESINWKKVKQRLFSYIVRIFFASGMSESLALDHIAGEASANLIASSRVSNFEFWENLSEIVLNSSFEERLDISHHLNTWTVGKDPVRSLYALLFSSQPIGRLQHAAYSLLTTDPFQTSAVIPGDMKDSIAEESLNIGSTESTLSTAVSLRCELAVVVETARTRILESALVSSLRVKYFLAWAIILSHLRSIPVSSTVGEKLVQYIQDSALSSTLLDSIFQHIPLSSEPGFSSKRKTSTSLWQAEIERVGDAARRACTLRSVSATIEGLWPIEEDTVSSLAAGLYGLLLQVLPACVRVWFTGLRDRSAAISVESFTTKFCSPLLLADEFAQVHNSTVADDSLSIKANQGLGEVIVVYKKEEAGMDMIIKMPKCYPLRAVDIECTKRLGISETRLRKWTLSMAAFLRNQNGAVAEAIQIWRQNVDREFEGVEECPICYSIIHTTNHSLPRLACKTCKHKFHAPCLYKWFSTSHKSTCPLCQTPF